MSGACCKACANCAKGAKGKRARLSNPSAPRSRAELDAIKHYAVTHWGLEGTGKMEDGVAGDPRGPSTLLGYVHTIIYIAPKGTPEMVEWEHRFSSRKPPALTYTKEGKLLLIGGGYKVGARGIAE